MEAFNIIKKEFEILYYVIKYYISKFKLFIWFDDKIVRIDNDYVFKFIIIIS